MSSPGQAGGQYVATGLEHNEDGRPRYDPETKPSQLIRPASGRLSFLLDAAAAAALPTPSGEAPYSASMELK